jgi:iron-sulfur cluster assembly protein
MLEVLHSPETLKLSITQKAAEKIKEEMKKQGENDSGLRLSVLGGGCSGYQYGLAFDRKNNGDHVIEAYGVKVLVDERSAQYVAGSEIDYVESVMGEGFMVNNPNAVETCGCGHSFKPK